jgi:hypothetical protein
MSAWIDVIKYGRAYTVHCWTLIYSFKIDYKLGKELAVEFYST